MKTIKITGKGQLKVKPDMIRISISLEGTYQDYAETLLHSSEDTEKLRKLLSAFDFEHSDLKTVKFNVDAKYERYEENDVYKSRLTGYQYKHLLKLEFDSDNKRLGKILYALGNCSLNPEFRISYTIKDQEAAKNELLGKAIQDAKNKAEVLTAAAGVKLNDIQSIDYSWGEIEFSTSPVECGMYMDTCYTSSESYDLDIEPDDIDVTDTVTVIWEIS